MRKMISWMGVTLLFLAGASSALAHCEIPCGIYDDKARAGLIKEHIGTIEKSMAEIDALSKDPVQNANQLTRWINNKEEHANEIQEIVHQYFMTQRIKPADSEDKAAYDKYVTELSLLHKMLRAAMKCKQTTDTAHTRSLEQLLAQFKASYFGGDMKGSSMKGSPDKGSKGSEKGSRRY